MQDIDIHKRTIGINFNKEGARILLWAPNACNIDIIINENTVLPLEKAEHGYWKKLTTAIKPGDLYKFKINNGPAYPDPASLAQPNDVHGASEAIAVTAFHWHDKNWKNISLEQYLLYELHTGTFTPNGTFEGIAEKLDHLIELGITAIEIMPVAQFPGNRNWGYDGVFPFAVQQSYGGAKGLQKLVDHCHQKGLAVVLDVVYNHLGPEGNYLGNFAPYFTNKYKTPWGDAINFDDTGCAGVRYYFIENALMWLRDFHIDALRLDAVHAIKDDSAVHILQEIKIKVDELTAYTGKRYYLIVESDLNEPRFINKMAAGGYGMDAQWSDDFHHALRVASDGSQNGYYADYNGIAHLAKAYTDAYVYDGQYSDYRKKNIGAKTTCNEGKQFVVFSQNHDQVGNRMLGERTSQLVSFEMQKLMAAAIMVSPFLPLLFMGEEWGDEKPFLYFVSHTDEVLAKTVRTGRKEEFAAFLIEGIFPDPVAAQTFEQSKLQWGLLAEPRHKTLFEFYKYIIALRKKCKPLAQLNRQQIKVTANTELQTITVERWHEEQHIICLMNFAKEKKVLPVPQVKETWHQILDSAAVQWGGQTTAPQTFSKPHVSITVQPQSILIYSNTHE